MADDNITPSERIALGVLTAEQAADLLRCSVESLAASDAPCIQLGRSRVYPHGPLLRWVSESAVPAKRVAATAVGFTSPARRGRRHAALPVLPSIT